jgi:hypothetical protein
VRACVRVRFGGRMSGCVLGNLRAIELGLN